MSDTTEHHIEPISPEAQAQAWRLLAPGSLLGVFVLVALAGLLILPGFSALPPLDAGEAGIIAATRDMLAHGAIIPAVAEGGPVILHWIQVVLAIGGGYGTEAPPWLLRLPSLLAGLVSVALVHAIAAGFAGRKAGLVAGGLLAAVALFGIYARLARPEAILLMAVVAALWALAPVWAETDPRRGTGRNLVFWAALGLGVALDPPMMMVIVGGTLGLLLARDRSLAAFRALDPAKGLAVALLIALPPLLAPVVLGDTPIAVALGGDVVSRLWGVGEGVRAPPGSHLLFAIATFWPMSALAPVALVFALARRPVEPAGRALRFLAAWILPAWLLVEAVPLKLAGDVLPLMPALAVAVGVAVATAPIPTGRWLVRIGMGLVAAGAAILALGLNVSFVLALGRASVIGLALGLLAVVVGFAASWFLIRGRFAVGLALTIVAAGATASLAFAVLLPTAGERLVVLLPW